MDETKRLTLKTLLAAGSLALTPAQLINLHLGQKAPLKPTASTSASNGHTNITSADFSIDWSTILKEVIATGLSQYPVVGELLSALVEILWPEETPDIWGQIEQQVEQLINQRLSELVYQQVLASLRGLHNNLELYQQALQFSQSDPTYVSEIWNVANGDFAQQLPTFQLPGYELLLLPLLAQFATLHLTLLRDGVLHGASWGWTPELVKQREASLKAKISDYLGYTNAIYEQGRQNVANNTPTNYHTCQPFRSINIYVRQMTLTVLDFSYFWPFFDPEVAPGLTQVPPPTREIYSDPVGTCDNSFAIKLPSAPTQPLSQLTVWAYDRIDAVQLLYPTGGGPGGETQSPRMGDLNGGSNAQPHGGVFNLSASNPIVAVSGLAYNILNAFTFTFQDGTSTWQLGGNYPGGDPYAFSYDSEILSSVHINGESLFYQSADCAVFGFQFPVKQTVQTTVNALKYFYISSPSSVTLSDLVKRLATPISLSQVAPKAAAENWESQRRTHQAKLRARVGR
jgi:hypothetical protein